MKGTVSVNEETRPIGNWGEGDLIQAINRRQRENVPLCVRVHIEETCANVTFATPMCQGGGGGRPPNQCEVKLLHLWQQLGLNTNSFKGGNVWRFLHDAHQIVN